jgi:hypothetical protein
MKTEKFHISGGKDWYENMLPDDLYKITNSSKERAIQRGRNLLS